MKTFTYIFVIVAIFFYCARQSTAQISEDDLTVEIEKLGKIKGKISITMGKSPRQYVSFLGMRYAEPPTGNGRFMPSIRFDKSLNETGDTFFATNTPVACSQPNVSFVGIPQNEDCLTINVQSPKPNGTSLLPVIFFIHGGAFTVGQGSDYDGTRLLNKDCVLVTFNYRLGVLGFFSLHTKSAPGNAALYDMLNALKWTRDYIKYFGGDPDRITIAGQSAGSAAVTHIVASPLFRGLFHRAIAASGSALAAWATTEDPLDNSLVIASKLGCYDGYSATYRPNETILDVITECMREVNPVNLVNVLFEYQVSERRNGRLGFDVVSPTVQTFQLDSSTGFEKIVPEHPRDVFESGKQANVPLMMGSTRHDGSYVLGVYYNRYLKDNGYLNDTKFMSKDAIPNILKALGIPDEYGVYESIGKMYLGDSRLTGEFEKMYPGFIDLFSVFFFKASSYQNALFHSRLNKDTYWYSFDYKGQYSLFSFLFIPTEIPSFKSGITHSDDMLYVFYTPLGEMNDDDSEVSNQMVEYWVNFATYGNPTPDDGSSNLVKWNPINAENRTQEFLSIEREPEMSSHYEDTWPNAGWELVLPPTDSTPLTTEKVTTPEEGVPPVTGTTGTASTESTTSTDRSRSSKNLAQFGFILFFIAKVLIFV